jgi:DNA-binding response OmpR family regulator
MGTEQILFVEPYGTTRFLYASVLKEENPQGWQVHVAETPDKAKEILKKEDVDLLVTHIHYPDGQGGKTYREVAELCKLARQQQRDSLPIILFDTQDLKRDSLEEHGFPDRNLERFNPNFQRSAVLVEKIKNLLANRAAEDSSH